MYRHNEDEYERESQRRIQERTEYLTNSAAIPTPMEAYALWLAVWEKQGNKPAKSFSDTYHVPYVTILDGAFKNSVMTYETAKSAGIPDELISRNMNYNYENFAARDWTPTRGGYNIPAGYGSYALKLFILPDVVEQSLASATNDWRDGWEWGHTNVFILVSDANGPGGFRAETNSRNTPSFSRDIVDMARSMSISSIAKLLHERKALSTNNVERELV
jgi:hypothetical protein